MTKSKKNDEEPRTAAELLEARVDAMMDPSAEPVPATPSVPDSTPATAPPLKGSPKPQPTVEVPLPELTLPQQLDDIAVTTETAPPADITIEPVALDTPDSDAAIDDIVAQEADEVLAAEDAGLAAQSQDDAIDEPQKHGHPIFWFIVFMLVILVVIAGVMLVNPNIDLPF